MAIASPTLFHYTDSTIAATIIQNKKIRLSPPWHLNDPREGKDFPELLDSFLVSKGMAVGSSVEAIEKINNHFYVACFSENGDMLSQWRAYANNANGISLGFDKQILFSVLRGQSNLVARPVEYADEVIDLAVSGEAYKAFNSIITHGPNSKPSLAYLQTLAKVRFAIKRKAYADEKEIRLIYTPNDHSASPAMANAKLSRQFFGGLDAIRDFYEMNFNSDIWPKLVTQVVLGPKNTSKISVVQDFLKSQGLHETQVITSAAHYR